MTPSGPVVGRQAMGHGAFDIRPAVRVMTAGVGWSVRSHARAMAAARTSAGDGVASTLRHSSPAATGRRRGGGGRSGRHSRGTCGTRPSGRRRRARSGGRSGGGDPRTAGPRARRGRSRSDPSRWSSWCARRSPWPREVHSGWGGRVERPRSWITAERPDGGPPYPRASPDAGSSVARSTEVADPYPGCHTRTLRSGCKLLRQRRDQPADRRRV